MARILYGVHGTGHGHAMRGLILARSLPEHEFLFIANDDAPKVLAPEFRVARLPNLGTKFRNYKVDLGATIRHAIPVLANRKKYIRNALDLIDEFQPDVCMTDLEYFVPHAAKEAGLPCLTLDHQHIITCCEHNLPANLLWDAALQGLTPRWLFKPTEANILISFYAPPVKPQYNAIVAPPILRSKTLSLRPENGGHILVYQSNSTDKRLIEFLTKATGRTAHVFGYHREKGRQGNVVFHERSEDEFGELLATCAYVIQGGSHTLMSEALYLGKPILSLPLLAMVEQRFNALYLERLGYGRQTNMAALRPELLEEFENSIPAYKANIAKGSFLGNDTVFALVDKFAKTGLIPDFKKSLPERLHKV